MIEAQEEERTRIARDLHDDINQRLALLAMDLSQLRQQLPGSANEVRQQAEAACKHVEDLGRDVQALSHQLHSSKLEHLGLRPAAASLSKDLAERHSVEIDFHSEGVPKDLPKSISLCLFRILQESLQNAIKHSKSRHIQVLLNGGSREVHLTVRDSGAGFDPRKVMKGPGLGLSSMKERLKLVEGELSIESKPKGGTTIHARVPLTPRIESAG